MGPLGGSGGTCSGRLQRNAAAKICCNSGRFSHPRITRLQWYNPTANNHRQQPGRTDCYIDNTPSTCRQGRRLSEPSPGSVMHAAIRNAAAKFLNIHCRCIPVPPSHSAARRPRMMLPTYSSGPSSIRRTVICGCAVCVPPTARHRRHRGPFGWREPGVMRRTGRIGGSALRFPHTRNRLFRMYQAGFAGRRG